MTAPTRTVGDRLAEDLRAAVTVLEASGWAAGQLHHAPSGAHDITGAIFVATGYHQFVDGGAWRAQALRNSAGRRASDCIRWLVRHLPTRTVWEFDENACDGVEGAVEVLTKAADAAERLLRQSRDVERLLS